MTKASVPLLVRFADAFWIHSQPFWDTQMLPRALCFGGVAMTV